MKYIATVSGNLNLDVYLLVQPIYKNCISIVMGQNERQAPVT